MTVLFNKANEKTKRKGLRKEMPKAELMLWGYLKNKQILGCKFRRQFSIDKYILDFYSPAIKLAIEIDGDSHFSPNAKIYDPDRQKFIESVGVFFLKFTNHEIYYGLEKILERIESTIRNLTSPNPSL